MVRTSFRFFFFNDTATTEIYTLSLHDALPILVDADRDHPPIEVVARKNLQPLARDGRIRQDDRLIVETADARRPPGDPDRKSTRLNSSHLVISYAVFCLKKKKKILMPEPRSVC